MVNPCDSQYTSPHVVITTTYPYSFRTTLYRTTSYPARTTSNVLTKPTQTPRVTVSTISTSKAIDKTTTVSTTKVTTKSTSKVTTKPTTKTTTTTTTTTTKPTTLPTTETTKHFQMIINKNFSEVTNLNNVLKELKPQVADLCGISVSRVNDLKIQEVSPGASSNAGKMAVTFDVHPSNKSSDRTVSGAYTAFRTRVNRASVLNVEGTEAKIKTFTSIQWKDDDKCQTSVCRNGTRCWRVQNMYSCVCEDCPKMPTQETFSKSTSSGLTTTNIIIIIVVVAVVALIIIIIVIVCVIRSSKDPEDEKYNGSQYSSDTEERYNTSFAN